MYFEYQVIDFKSSSNPQIILKSIFYPTNYQYYFKNQTRKKQVLFQSCDLLNCACHYPKRDEADRDTIKIFEIVQFTSL